MTEHEPPNPHAVICSTLRRYRLAPDDVGALASAVLRDLRDGCVVMAEANDEQVTEDTDLVLVLDDSDTSFAVVEPSGVDDE